MNKYKLIIFDFDGTLVATHKAISLCINKTFQKFNVTPPSGKNIIDTIGLSLEDTFKSLYPAIDKNDISEWISVYRTFYRLEGEAQTYLFPNTKEVLNSAVKSGLNLVISSNKGTEAIHSALERFGIKQFIKLAIGETEQIKKKPDPMVFYSVIQPAFSDIKKNQILLVGDTATDLLFAKNANLDSCWASYGYGRDEQCLELKPNFIIENLSELYPIIRLSE